MKLKAWDVFSLSERIAWPNYLYKVISVDETSEDEYGNKFTVRFKRIGNEYPSYIIDMFKITDSWVYYRSTKDLSDYNIVSYEMKENR